MTREQLIEKAGRQFDQVVAKNVAEMAFRLLMEGGYDLGDLAKLVVDTIDEHVREHRPKLLAWVGKTFDDLNTKAAAKANEEYAKDVVQPFLEEQQQRLSAVRPEVA